MRDDGDFFKNSKKSQYFSDNCSKTNEGNSRLWKKRSGIGNSYKKAGHPVNEMSDYSTNILEIIQNDPLVIQSGVKNKLEDLNISISQPTISRSLKKLQITRKRTKKIYQQVTKPRIINERKANEIKYRKIQISRMMFVRSFGFHWFRHYSKCVVDMLDVASHLHGLAFFNVTRNQQDKIYWNQIYSKQIKLKMFNL